MPIFEVPFGKCKEESPVLLDILGKLYIPPGRDKVSEN